MGPMPAPRNRQADQGFLQTLQAADLFSTLLDEDVHFITSKTEVRAYSEGETLFKAGDQARQFYMIMSGKIGIYRQDSTGKELCLAQFVTGEAFGDMDFVMQAKFNARAEALESSALLLFPRSGTTLEDLAKEAPGTIARLLMRALAMMSSRLRSTNLLINEKRPWIEELRRQIYCDPSTGLWNKTYLEEEIPRFLQNPSVLILMKPDRFKDLNDARGHSAGDEAMVRIATLLSEEASDRGRSWAVRIKSNETALIWTGANETDALSCIDSLSKRLNNVVFEATSSAPEFRFSGSFAYALWPMDDQDWSRLTKKTADVLLQVWNEGGGKVCRIGQPSRPGVQG